MDARIVEVVERPLGSALAADAAAGATTLLVADPSDFDDDGTLTIGGETHGYVCDLDTATLTLDSPLVGAFTTDTLVSLSPVSLERLATLIGQDDAADEEGMIARVPHALYDRVPVGIRGLDDAESVVADYQADELVILDLTGQAPVVDGTYIDPPTLPAPPSSDGLPPATSPPPTLVPGLGTLHAFWTGITNADVVTYELHVSLTDGFTPSSSTLLATTDATAATIRSLPPTLAPLDPALTYYVRVVARDEDGAASASAQASAMPAYVTGPDIAAQTITGGNIVGETITADLLAAVLVMAAQIVTPAESGQRVVVDPAGIRLIASDESVLVNLPTDPSLSPTFQGNVITGGLQVTGNARIQGATNQMEKGSQLTLQAQLGAPALAPNLAFEYDTDLTSLPGCIGLDCDPSGHKSDGSTGMTYLFVYDDGTGYSIAEWDPATKVVSRTQRFAAYGPTPLGVARVGSGGSAMIGLLYVGTDGLVKLRTYLQSTFGTTSALGTTTLAYGSPGILNSEVRLGTDGTNWWLVGWDSTSSTSVKRVTIYDGSVATGMAVIDQHTVTGGILRGTAGTGRHVMCGCSARGGSLVVGTFYTPSGDELVTYETYSTSTWALLTSAGSTWCPTVIPSSGNSVDTLWQGGISYDTGAAAYRGLCGSGILVKFSGFTWTVDASTNRWWAGVTFYQATGTLETVPSPQASILLDGSNPAARSGSTTSDVAMRGQLRVIGPPIPTDASTERVYMVRAAPTPATTSYHLQTPAATGGGSGTTPFTAYIRSYSAAGAAPPTTNTFPAGTSTITGDPGAAVVSGGQWKLGGDGSFTLPRFTARMASPSKGQLQWNEARGVPEYWDGAAWRTGVEIVTAAVDLPSTAAHSSGFVLVTIPGLNVGDACFWLGAVNNTGIPFHVRTRVFCTVANQIRLDIYNADSATNDPASIDHYFMVVRFT